MPGFRFHRSRPLCRQAADFIPDRPADRTAPAPIRVLIAGLLGCSFAALPLAADVFTVQTKEQTKIDGHYLDFHPTNVALPTQKLDARGHQELIRILDAEQGFAVRPLPRGTKGIVLHANGPVKPAGLDYVNSLSENGISSNPGDRVVITDVRIDPDRLVLELNGGPEHKHRFLRHVQLGVGGGGTTAPIVQDEADPTGSRVVLVFDKYVPEMTGTQVKQLLAPVLNFEVKTPVEAYTDTLPPKLRQTIQNHEVLVGMDDRMVLSALGQPRAKSRERDGDMPFEEWIYGEPPKPIEFVRFNGNRVIRIEIAKVGEPPVVRSENEMGDYWSTVPNPNERQVQLGDVASSEPEGGTDRKAAGPPRKKGAPEVQDTSIDDTKNRPQPHPVEYPHGVTPQPLPPPPSGTPNSQPPQPGPGSNMAQTAGLR